MPLTQAQLNTQGWQIFTANLGNISVELTQGNLQISTPSTGKLVLSKLVLSVSGQYQPAITGV